MAAINYDNVKGSLIWLRRVWYLLLYRWAIQNYALLRYEIKKFNQAIPRPIRPRCFDIDIVEPGHRAIKFNKISGVGTTQYSAGYNIKFPWLERPIIFDIKTHPRIMTSVTGSKGKRYRLIEWSCNDWLTCSPLS